MFTQVVNLTIMALSALANDERGKERYRIHKLAADTRRPQRLVPATDLPNHPLDMILGIVEPVKKLSDDSIDPNKNTVWLWHFSRSLTLFRSEKFSESVSVVLFTVVLSFRAEPLNRALPYLPVQADRAKSLIHGRDQGYYLQVGSNVHVQVVGEMVGSRWEQVGRGFKSGLKERE
ncbi:hypothetical protein R1sor_015751 [Riccia sorocarpa]|uniref:Uncharacterized protein n=1 Tax=Riccia sorocarpa TaxID=122646 RepID=A0ABD3HG73_9MARC